MPDADHLADVESALVDHFGQRPVRASVSFLGVQPIDVLRFEPVPGERAYVTLGMSRAPMTGADAVVVAATGPRAELMMHVDDPADRFADVWRWVALLAAAPAVEGVVYAPGMSVDLGEQLVPGSMCTGAVITESPLAPIASEAGEVSVLQAVPATATELAWCRVHGSAPLLAKWAAAGVDVRDLGRAAVSLAE